MGDNFGHMKNPLRVIPLCLAALSLANADTEKDAKLAKAAEAAKAESVSKSGEVQKAAESAKAEADSKSAEAEKANSEKSQSSDEAKAAEAAKQVAAAKSAEIAKEESARRDAEIKNGEGKESPVQSAARPFKLDIAAPVQLAGSSASSAEFQKGILPGFEKLVNERLAESKAIEDLSASRLDPSKLTLAYDSNVRVYFVGEGAGYRNSLGFSTTGGGIDAKDAALIFPDASSNNEKRNSDNPLLAGDFVDLGKFSAGSQLDFFLIANGVNGGRDVFTTQQSENRDGLVHAVSIAPEGSSFLLIGFEDLFKGGDRDYNDLVFAVEIGRENVANLASLAAPEPSLAFGSAFAGVALLGYRRRTRI